VIELRCLINGAMLRAHDFKFASCARKNGFVARAYVETNSRKCEFIHTADGGSNRNSTVPGPKIAPLRPSLPF
jgi:hypothetical protein